MSHQAAVTTILKALDGKYFDAAAITNIIATAHFTGKNAILFGPPGFGKSEMSKIALEALGYSIDAPEADRRLFIQSFGEGMTEDRLYGGINFKKLNQDDVCEFNAGSGVGASFLDCGAAIFEEIFDAPPKVLLSLKDTLTAGMLRNGPQMVKSKCRVIIANTNHNPEDIADLGPAVKALIERFPLQLNVLWTAYNADAYIQMLKKVRSGKPYKISDPLINVLGEICAESHGVGITVSPRTAVHAMDMIALCNNGEQLGPEDFEILRLIPEFLTLTDVSEKFQREIENMNFNMQIKGFKLALGDLQSEVRKIMSLEKHNDKDSVAFMKQARTLAAALEDLNNKVQAVRGTDVSAAIKAEFENTVKGSLEELASETQRLMEK